MKRPTTQLCSYVLVANDEVTGRRVVVGCYDSQGNADRAWYIENGYYNPSYYPTVHPVKTAQLGAFIRQIAEETYRTERTYNRLIRNVKYWYGASRGKYHH